MDTEKVREFVAFSRFMSFRAAARELNMSQPALSQHVRDLEGEIGATLVNRSPGEGCSLTPAGIKFLEMGKRLLQVHRELLEACREANADVPSLRVQALNSGFGISAQLKQMLAANGHLSVNVEYIKLDCSVVAALDSGLIDLGVWNAPSPDGAPLPPGADKSRYASVRLNPEPLVVLVGKGNPLAELKEVPLAVIDEGDFYWPASPSYEGWDDVIMKLLAARGCTPSLHALPDRVAGGGAIPLRDDRAAITTARYARHYCLLEVEDVVSIPIEGDAIAVYPYLIYKVDNEAPMLQRVLACMGAS